MTTYIWLRHEASVYSKMMQEYIPMTKLQFRESRNNNKSIRIHYWGIDNLTRNRMCEGEGNGIGGFGIFLQKLLNLRNTKHNPKSEEEKNS